MLEGVVHIPPIKIGGFKMLGAVIKTKQREKKAPKNLHLPTQAKQY